MLGIELDTVSLDAEQFSDDPGIYALAKVVSEEMDAQRDIQSVRAGIEVRKFVGSQRVGYTRISDFLKPELLTARLDREPWYAFLTNLDALRRCAERLGLSVPDAIKRISTEIHPPNWQTLFWMRAFLVEAHNRHGELAKVAAEFDKRVQDEAVRIVSEGAKKAAGARHAENRDMRAEAIAWYTARRDTLSKDAAAEQIAGKVLPVKFRTVRDWLKGQ